MTNSKKNKGKKSNKSSLNSLTRKNNGKQSQSSTITSNKKQFSSNQSQIQNKNTSNVSSLQDKFKKKLEGARFRVINEQLYTCTGNEAYDSFQQDKNLFKVVITKNL
jgi:ribosomal RNA-processing protein 8